MRLGGLKVLKYSRIWLRLALMRFKELYLESRLNSLFLISGKLVRFSFFLIFIIALLTQTQKLAGFSLYQTLLFFMTFNLIDITTQFLLRGTYGIRLMLDRGEIDLFLTQPINALFRIGSDIIDLLDFFTLLPVLMILGIVISKLETSLNPENFLLYLILCFNGFLIAFALHVFIIALLLLTQEISSTIWIYRDFMTMGRFPIDIYSKALQFVLTFLLPIAVMVSFPSKVLIGILSWQWVIIAFVISGIFLCGALLFWRYALKCYSGISS